MNAKAGKERRVVETDSLCTGFAQGFAEVLRRGGVAAQRSLNRVRAAPNAPLGRGLGAD
jgi:hypothetical protein